MPHSPTLTMPPSAFFQVAPDLGLEASLIDPERGCFTLAKDDKKVLCWQIPCCVTDVNPRPGVYINGFVEVGGPRTGPAMEILRRELAL